MRQFLNLSQRYFPLLLNLEHSLALLDILRGEHPLHLYAIGDLLLEGEGHIEELLVVDVLLLGLEVEELEVVDVFELEALRVSHGILYRKNGIQLRHQLSTQLS